MKKKLSSVAQSLKKMVRYLKFRIYEEEGLYYLCSENTGADQLRLSKFSHDAAQL